MCLQIFLIRRQFAGRPLRQLLPALLPISCRDFHALLSNILQYLTQFQRKIWILVLFPSWAHRQWCTIIIVRSISSDNSCFAKIENDIISQSEKMHRSSEEASERTQLCIENANIGLSSCSPLQCDDGQDIYLTISAAPNIRLGQQISENEKPDLRLFEISRIIGSFLIRNEINSCNTSLEKLQISFTSEAAIWSVNKSKIFDDKSPSSV